MLDLYERMQQKNEYVHAVLYHARGQDLGEGLVISVEVAEHGVALSPEHQADVVCVNMHKEELHCTDRMEGSHTDACLSENDFWAHGMDDSAYVSVDLVATDDVHILVVIDRCKGFV